MYHLTTIETNRSEGDKVVTTAGVYIRSDDTVELPGMTIDGSLVLRGKGINSLPRSLLVRQLDFEGTSIPYASLEDSEAETYRSVLLGDQYQSGRTNRVRICAGGFFGTHFEFLEWVTSNHPSKTDELHCIASSLVSRATSGDWD